jgi:Mandelate racemase / muconate lactonizing enzyme, N-terminal domain
VRITEIRLRRLAYPLDPPLVAAWDPTPRRALEATLVFVSTDEGLTGIGSGDTMDGFERFSELFLGRDPLELERHVRVLETISFHAGRYWPLEAALWDLAGQAAGVPVAQLLGGRDDRIAAYASTGTLLPPAARVEATHRLLAEGFRALKLRVEKSRLEEGLATVAAVREAAGAENLNGKVLVDISNPLDFSQGRPPTLSVSNTDSLGEQIQRRFVETKVVKTLHTMNAYLMVDPTQLAEAEHTVFVCGDDAEAKARVTELLQGFGWTDILDLGDISAARGTEMIMPIWLRLFGALQKPVFNFKIVR